jgi:hypothetical protein
MKNHESFSQILSSYESFDSLSKTQSKDNEYFIEDTPSVDVQISNHAKLLSFISLDSQPKASGNPQNTSSIHSAKEAFIKLNRLLSVLH